jgi:hypothetical protein
MKRERIWKLFRLPSPSKLGMTDDTTDEALGMRMFQNPGDNSPTWEDWEERVQKEYPIRYYFAEQLLPNIKCLWQRYVKDTWYWIRCHTYTKYHMLDLRQPKKDPLSYRFGWIDSDTQIVYALFCILNNFVAEELPHAFIPSEEDVAKEPHLLSQRNNYLEVKAIHYWWNVQRLREAEAEQKLLHEWSDSRKTNGPATQQLWADLNKMENANKDKLDEMLIRLVKVRGCLWT